MAYTFKHGDRPLDDFTIQRAVGRGGFGEVYYALSDGGREVALKYLRENPQIELRGVSHCINLKSPHLVTIFDVKKSEEDEYFIIMEYVSGPSLRDLLIAEPNGLGAQKAAFFVRELAKGLSYLHDRGIVHRDLKPGNVFYEDGYVKIGDYGLSKFISVSRHSAQTASIGTVHYMAPEVGSGNYSRGIDIYALGVILYEMLLGKVPYEGATMGEVLMKHLTAQPEVDELSEPFGRVIRKALAKDPNERYQSVDEMVAELFDVADVRDSLVGFNPTGLTQAAARGARDIGASPVPSPNPPPPANAAPRADRWDELGDRLTAKARRIGERVARRMDALDRRVGRRRAGPPPPPAGERERSRRVLLSVLVALGIAVAAGVVTGLTFRPEELGIAAALLTVGMSAGLALSRWAVRSLGPQAEPPWVQRLVTIGCAMPLMVPGIAVTFDATYTASTGLGVLGGLAAALLLVDWQKRFETGAAGELRVGSAFAAGLCALVAGAIVSEGRSEGAWLAAIVVAATSLTVQAVAWFWSSGHPVQVVETTKQHTGVRGHRLHRFVRHVVRGAVPASERESPPAPTPGAPPFGVPVESESYWARMASREPLPPLRWTVARGFWSVVAFCLFGGMVVTFLMPILLRLGSDDTCGAIVGCIACFSFLAFALQKTTQRCRRGFWRETLRPFLIAITMTGLGAAITGLSLYSFNSEELLAIVAGLVMAAMLLLVLLVSTLLPSRPNFVMHVPVFQSTAEAEADHGEAQPDSATVDVNVAAAGETEETVRNDAPA